jgi:hypothetical protein
MSFYLDGKLISTSPITLDTPWGSRFVSGGVFDGRESLKGAVDEICIYDRSLSSDEIATLYKSLAPTHPSDPLHMTGMVSYWPADGDLKDLGPGRNDFELVNGAAFSDGIRGQAFHFDGVDDLAQATTHKFPSDDDDRSLVFWFRADDFVTNESVFADYGTLGEVTAVYGLGLNYRFPYFSNWGDGAVQDDREPPVEPGRWYHLAASTSKGETLLYLDGKVIAKTNMTLNTTPDTTLYIGSLPGIHARGRKLKGALDEVSIYNRALSSDEINFLYSNQR